MESFLESVIAFNNTSNTLKIVKSYEGKVDQKIVKDFTEEIEQYFNLPENAFKGSRKVFHVMVEMLQNIGKHSLTKNEKKPNIGEGVFVLASENDNFYIRIGNIAKTEDIKKVIAKIDEFNPLNPDEIKLKFKELIKASRISDKGGAGLGLIDIIKKTKNKMAYHNIEVNSNNSFFIQQALVSR